MTTTELCAPSPPPSAQRRRARTSRGGGTPACDGTGRLGTAAAPTTGCSIARFALRHQQRRCSLLRSVLIPVCRSLRRCRAAVLHIVTQRARDNRYARTHTVWPTTNECRKQAPRQNTGCFWSYIRVCCVCPYTPDTRVRSTTFAHMLVKQFQHISFTYIRNF